MFKNVIAYLKNKSSKLFFPVIGFLSLIWFLIRVIPKPTRAAYPCMQTAAPLASGFIVYIMGIAVSILAWRQTKFNFYKARFISGLFSMLVLVIAAFMLFSDSATDGYASAVEDFMPNDPVGIAQGNHEGRVVWVWNADATNENCTLSHNGDGVADDNDDGYFLDKNTNQSVVDNILSKTLRELTGSATDKAAWDSLFHFFNFKKHSLENTGYQQGEKIFIKINATSTWGKGQSWGNITDNYDKTENNFYAISETSPQIVLSVLRQLITIYGIPQEMISVGDPMKYLYNHSYDKWHSEFPNVHYMAQDTDKGREAVVATDEDIIFYSDKGAVLDQSTDKIYTVMNDANYMVNIPVLKAHARAGITIFAKNHFGSHTRESAQHLHPGLVAPNEGPPTRTDYGLYRVLTDMMTHERIGQNTMLFLLDALWAGSEATDPPTKWDMAPFNGDWTSSIIASQDPVAIESVCFDFLRTEYDGTGDKVNYPNMGGVDDYLLQAADSTNWPDGIKYDPENDGVFISSLGVHEHWNNATDRKYSRNLGTGEGIEFIFIDQNATALETGSPQSSSKSFALLANYPNPFNPTTTIPYHLSQPAQVKIEIYNALGKHFRTLLNMQINAGAHSVVWDGKDNNGTPTASGLYFCRFSAESGQGIFVDVQKIMLIK